MRLLQLWQLPRLLLYVLTVFCLVVLRLIFSFLLDYIFVAVSSKPTPAPECPSSCTEELCNCLEVGPFDGCDVTISEECAKDSSQCLAEYFPENEIAVTCSTATCFSEGKSVSECRCQFVSELCNEDPALEFQCSQSTCCMQALSDSDRDACFETAPVSEYVSELNNQCSVLLLMSKINLSTRMNTSPQTPPALSQLLLQ